ncbi:MAG: hypothetical protein MJ221_02280 [Bacilli bacterium]|nr:hypothetical protein [Bacilli bacterium]
MKSKWHFKWSVVIYCAICNIPVCFFLCLTSSIIAASTIGDRKLVIDFASINWLSMWINYGIAFVLAMCIGVFVPLTDIGRWFTGLFHIKNDTYTGNVPYRLLSTLIISCIYYIVITPTLTLLSVLVFKSSSWDRALISMAINCPIMILVGFTSSLISDIFAFKVAHHIDPTL